MFKLCSSRVLKISAFASILHVERGRGGTNARENLRETRDVSASFSNGQDRVERVDGPAISERRRPARRRRQQGGGCCC